MGASEMSAWSEQFPNAGFRCGRQVVFGDDHDGLVADAAPAEAGGAEEQNQQSGKAEMHASSLPR